MSINTAEWEALCDEKDNEIERLRIALLDAIGEMESMIPYVPDYFREKWNYDGAIANAKTAAQSGRSGDPTPVVP